jgi:hypothetical protein
MSEHDSRPHYILLSLLPSQQGAALVLDTMRRSVAESAATEVHHKSVVLGCDNEEGSSSSSSHSSPPGFTSCVLIDESHVTAHCYSDRGWLAIDVFTCGANTQMPRVSNHETDEVSLINLINDTDVAPFNQSFRQPGYGRSHPQGAFGARSFIEATQPH